MTGIRELPALLTSLEPVLVAGLHTFAHVTPEEMARLSHPPLATFREREGITLICPLAEAEELGLRHEGKFRQITLSVHSSLAAIGLTAAVSTELARHHIPCNVVAAFFHDHLFVPADKADRALTLLQSLADST